jgi:cell division protein FtsB
MASDIELDRQLAEAENELVASDNHRTELIARIKQLRQRKALLDPPAQPGLELPIVAVSNQSNQVDKIAL